MPSKCEACRDGASLSVPFSMAFQPIVDISTGAVFAFESLVRGPAGEPAHVVLGQIDEANRYAFDQQCRVKSIDLATRLGIAGTGAMLSINFLPNAVYEPRACIRLTLEAAQAAAFPSERLMFEFTESEALDTAHVSRIVSEYRAMGFKVALDDFGAGHAGLGLLTRIQPDIIKLDMELIRDLDTDRRKHAIVKNLLAMLADLGIEAVCEGVETAGELEALRALGVTLIQGYLIAKPAFEALPVPNRLSGNASTV